MSEYIRYSTNARDFAHVMAHFRGIKIGNIYKSLYLLILY